MNLLTLPSDFKYYFSRKFSLMSASYYAEKCLETFESLNRIGYITLIDGPIRSGKSTACSILVNYLIQKLDEKASNLIQFIKVICFKVDFERLDNVILSCDMQKMTFSDMVKFILLDPQFADGFSGYYDNGLRLNPRRIYVADYVEAFLAFTKKNYVSCNIPFVDAIYHLNSEYIDVDDFSILDLIPHNKDDLQYIRKYRLKYNLSRFKVYFIDDMSIYSNMNSLNFSKFKGSDTGFSTCWRLFGQMMKECGYIIFNSQTLTRIVKESREIVQTFLHIDKKETKLNYISAKNFLNKRLRILSRFHSSDLDYKTYLTKLQCDFLDAASYLSISLSFRDSLGNVLPEDPFTITAPVNFGYGCIDSKYFSFIHDLLLKITESDFNDCLTDLDFDHKIEELCSNLDVYQTKLFFSLLRQTQTKKSKSGGESAPINFSEID